MRAKCRWCQGLFEPSAALRDCCSPAHAAEMVKVDFSNRFVRHLFGMPGVVSEEYLALFRALMHIFGATLDMTPPELAVFAEDLQQWAIGVEMSEDARSKVGKRAAGSAVPSKRPFAVARPKVVPFNRQPEGAR